MVDFLYARGRFQGEATVEDEGRIGIRVRPDGWDRGIWITQAEVKP